MAAESREQQRTAKLDPLPQRQRVWERCGGMATGDKEHGTAETGQVLGLPVRPQHGTAIAAHHARRKGEGGCALSPGCKLNSVVWTQNQKVTLISLYSYSS